MREPPGAQPFTNPTATIETDKVARVGGYEMDFRDC